MLGQCGTHSHQIAITINHLVIFNINFSLLKKRDEAENAKNNEKKKI